MKRTIIVSLKVFNSLLLRIIIGVFGGYKEVKKPQKLLEIFNLSELLCTS